MFLYGESGPGVLRYALAPGTPVDELTLEALKQNPPEGVFVLGRETTEEIDHLLIPVAGTVPLPEAVSILKEEMDPDKLLEEVTRIRSSLPGYLIPEEQLVLRPELTFLDPETGAVRLLCLPVPEAQDLGLTPEAYAILVRTLLEDASALPEKGVRPESANRNRGRKTPARTLRQRLRDYWENLD